MQTRGCQTFSVQNQMANILGKYFTAHMVSVESTQFCHQSIKAAVGNMGVIRCVLLTFIGVHSFPVRREL